MKNMLILLSVLFMISFLSGCIQNHPAINVSGQNDTSSPVISVIPTVIPTLTSPPPLNITEYKVFKGTDFTYSSRVPIRNITITRIWIFGKDSVQIFSVPVKNEDYNLTLSKVQTQGMNLGNYTIIVQYPGTDNIFGINPVNRDNKQVILDKNDNHLIDLSDIGRPGSNGLDSAKVLMNDINISGNGDTFSEIPLIVDEYSITINPIIDHHIGDAFIINGTTNLPADSQLNLEIVSGINLGSIKCEVNNRDEYESCSNSLLRQTRVEKSSPYNTWNFSVNTSNLRPGTLNGELSFGFFVVVNGVDPNTEISVSNSTSFNLMPDDSYTLTSPRS
jgi:hypothetical protein